MYRSIAPISAEAWKEIDQRAEAVLLSQLSARKSVHVNGPHGAAYTAVDEGRLGAAQETKDVCYATYQVKPLVETRVEFELNRFELDNVVRGALDVDLSALEEAAKQMAEFEENAVYNGLKEAGIEGLVKAAEGKTISLGKSAFDILGAIAKGILQLENAYAKKPYDLICSESVYAQLASAESSVPVLREIERMIGGQVIVSKVLKGALLVPHDHSDLELTIGSDFEIGYQAHDINRVRLYMKESFTFRVLDPAIIVLFK